MPTVCAYCASLETETKTRQAWAFMQPLDRHVMTVFLHRLCWAGGSRAAEIRGHKGWVPLLELGEDSRFIHSLVGLIYLL